MKGPYGSARNLTLQGLLGMRRLRAYTSSCSAPSAVSQKSEGCRTCSARGDACVADAQNSWHPLPQRIGSLPTAAGKRFKLVSIMVAAVAVPPLNLGAMNVAPTPTPVDTLGGEVTYKLGGRRRSCYVSLR